MSVTALMRLGLAGVACVLLAGCSSVSSSGAGGGGDCVSQYDPIVAASSWPKLRSALVGAGHFERRGVSVRTQARGVAAGTGGHDQDLARVVDLLDRRERRIVQLDVWRTEAGPWRAGAWNQCID
jgi:hypothetical protein